jgi:hypothetical protein
MNLRILLQNREINHSIEGNPADRRSLGHEIEKQKGWRRLEENPTIRFYFQA